MNGIEKITQRIETDTQAEIDRILGDARAEADDITGRYQAQANNEAAELAAKNQKAAAEREERLVSTAQMEARKVGLAAKQEMVEKAYALALEKLCSMPDEKYVQTVADLLVQAAPNGRGAVIFAPAERERIGEAAVRAANEKLHGGKLTLAEETRPLKGGFILSDGKVEVNCSFDTLVRLQKAETAGAAAKKLFPEI
ncbi:V-type ATP synthase subunit E [Dysosmobacter sp. Sow4_B12]|uniref:V-type ATP synthase subunit E n=1 Tax=Dysosmobacter sp. Sow4_B12 TaxID=3438777 RepID=UPI003F9348F9